MVGGNISKTILGVIPARYESSRFPGKPLADICGKPMIWHTYNRVRMAKGMDKVVVALDDERVANVCDSYDIDYIFTSNSHFNGESRVAEVSSAIDSDYYLMICGDEPIIDPDAITKMCDIIQSNGDQGEVITFRCPIHNPVDIANPTIIKVVVNKTNHILMASRSTIPFPSSSIDFDYYKVTGIYAYPKRIMKIYRDLPIGPLERIENHGIIRLIENEISILSIPFDFQTISVDTPKDIERVKSLIIKNQMLIDDS